MKNLGYYNGTVDEIERITIPMTDRAVYFGDGCYDALYARNHRMYCLSAHLDRLYRSASFLDIEPPMEKEALADLLTELLAQCDNGNVFIYVQFSRGTALREHTYGKNGAMASNLTITMTPEEIDDTYRAVRAITVPDTRFLHCHVKTLNLLPNVLAAEEARRAGCSEAIFYRPFSENGEDGIVTECAHSNVHAIVNGVLRTHPTDCHILPGISRANILRMCRELGIPYSEVPVTRRELYSAEEIIVSSCGALCVPVCEIDGQAVGGKNPTLLRALQDALFLEWVRETE